ncbi:MAG TPA: N-formylglutamate deformylase [Parvularculaceae bacterium]|nr:N-formylglutamate deformylase [Parvularculaceae bacterium]
MARPQTIEPAPPPVDIIEGEGPVILCQPHSGTWLPASLYGTLNERGRALADTDWHVDRLYEGLLSAATIIHARFHRYVIDANRPPSGASLYPGQNTTGLCPLTNFDGAAIYEQGREPDATEIEARRLEFHSRYHAAIERAIARAKARHGLAVIYDCHSIRSRIPYLFDGELPVFNIGTNGGASCDPRFESAVREICAASGESWVLNGRFKGGWTTRQYGKPQENVHAIQMELAQRAYMSEAPPWEYEREKAAALRKTLVKILEAIREVGHTPASSWIRSS